MKNYFDFAEKFDTTETIEKNVETVEKVVETENNTENTIETVIEEKENGE